MPEFICEMCGKNFTSKASLTYHTTNNVCMQMHNDCNEDNKYICKACSRKFTTSSAMYRHINHTCKIKKHDEQIKKEIYEALIKTELEKALQDKLKTQKKEHQKDMELMENKIKTLNDEINKLKTTQRSYAKNINTKNVNTKNIIHGGVNNGTVNNNIILVGYGKEDISKLSKTELLKVLQTGYHSTVKLTEAVHFNPKYPEYHNVYISNMKDKYAMMFDGKKWTLTIKEDLINQIYEDKKNYIEENLEEFVNSLPQSRKKALERWLDTDDEDQKIKEIKENIKLLLYNSRQLVCDAPGQQKPSYVKQIKNSSDSSKTISKSRKIPKHVEIDE